MPPIRILSYPIFLSFILIFVLPKSTWDYIVQFWYLDLSQTDSIMQECYSVFGPEPRLPSCMLRSYLLALKLKVTSITVWCRMLRETPLYAILSGFPFGDTPGVGTFYDFFFRIWQNDSDNLSPKDRFPKMKPPKGKKKGEKTPCDSSSTASKLLPLLEHWKFKPENPFSLVFRLYQQQFLDRSIRKGLIDPDHLALAGDGTPVRTAAQQRKNGSAIARKKAVLPAAANAIILSLTATGDGTLIGNAISSVTTSTCMWPPIPTAISLYFRFWNGLPGMICFLFYILFSP
mgnify:CR=1 FL=1